MALVKYGGGIIQMTGSIAGNTHARNRYGNYIRARTKPINPNSARQVVIRSCMATLTERWSDILTSDQRTAWNLYAASLTMKNRLGEAIHLTGFNHYIRSNSIRLQSSLALIDAGPTDFSLPEKDTTLAITASKAAQEIEVTFDNTMAWAKETGAFMLTYQGQPQNPQRNFFNGPWRLMDNIVGLDATGITSPDVEAVPFAIAEGQRQWIYVRIARLDGRLSEKFFTDIVVAA